MTSKKRKAASRRGKTAKKATKKAAKKTAKKRGARSRGSRSQGEAVSDPPDIHVDMLAEFFEATAAFAAAEARFVDTGAFRLDAPAVGLEGVVACYVDFDSDGAGFLVLPSVQHYRDLTTAGDQPPRDRSGVLVLLAPPEALPRATRRELEGLGWRRSEDARIPVLTKQGADGDEQLPAAEDYRVATLAATVMTHVARTTGDELSAGNAAYQCTIGIPGWGDVGVLHPGDVDQDELASIDEDAIEATIRLPEDALAAGLEVDVLSPRARRVLERARPAEDAPGVELTATLEELAHVGSLLGAASRQPGRPAILHELSTRLLQASRGPEVWAIDPPPGEPGPVGFLGAGAPRGRDRPPGRRGKEARPKRRLYRLKVTLRGVRPPIWRRLELRSDITLGGLHSALQRAMGWSDCHLHEFECDGERYGASEDEYDDVLDERTTRLDELLREPGDSLDYLYDFGDGWEHRVVLEAAGALPAGQRAPRPRCIDGRRACPPEDCGGPGGYARMLRALANPRDPEHASYREWLGAGFDPEAFQAVDP